MGSASDSCTVQGCLSGSDDRIATEDSQTRFLTSAPPRAGGDFESLNFATPTEILSYNVDDLLYSLAVVTEAGVFRQLLERVDPLPWTE